MERAAYHRRPGSQSLGDEHVHNNEVSAHSASSGNPFRSAKAAAESSAVQESQSIALGPEYHSIMYAASNVELPEDQHDGQGSKFKILGYV